LISRGQPIYYWLKMGNDLLEQSQRLLENLCRAKDIRMLVFQAGSNQILELEKETDGKFHCIGLYISSNDDGRVFFYERHTKKDPVGEHLLRTYGPDHVYGRGPDPYLSSQWAQNKHQLKDKEFFKDLRPVKAVLEEVTNKAIELINKKLIPSPNIKTPKEKNNMEI